MVIPNGISSWTIENESNNLESESSTITSNNLVDYLTITITRRDTTIDLVYIKGLLNALLLNLTITTAIMILMILRRDQAFLKAQCYLMLI